VFGIDNIITEALTDRASVESVMKLAVQINELKEEVRELKDKGQRFEKDYYTLKDLEPILHCQAGTIRKNYIKHGKIKAHIPEGQKEYVVTADEYKRVQEVCETKGRRWL